MAKYTRLKKTEQLKTPMRLEKKRTGKFGEQREEEKKRRRKTGKEKKSKPRERKIGSHAVKPNEDIA